MSTKIYCDRCKLPIKDPIEITVTSGGGRIDITQWDVCDACWEVVEAVVEKPDSNIPKLTTYSRSPHDPEPIPEPDQRQPQWGPDRERTLREASKKFVAGEISKEEFDYVYNRLI